MIRGGVGLSTRPQAVEAAREAVERSVSQLDGARPDWCVAFATSGYASELDAMLETLSQAAGTPYVVGCSAAGVVAEGREIEGGPALGVLTVASDTIRATPFLFHDDGDQGLTAGIRLGQRLMGSRGTSDLVLVWPDPYRVRPDRLLQGMDATLGKIPVAGGAASANGLDPTTLQFSGSDSSPSAVSGIRLGGEFQHRVAISQGCRPLCEPMRVTRSHDNLILEIDGRPATDAVRDRVPIDLFDDLECALETLFIGLLPDAPEVPVLPGEYLVRSILAADPDTGVLAIAGTVEEGEYVLFAMREPHSARGDLVRSLSQVSSERSGLDYRFGFYFNCLARGKALYREEGVDAALLSRMLPGVPLLGFFCNAEIAPLRGVNQLFTYTGVLVLVAD
jgi:small ligand-binding sensory domain FIST